MSAPVRQVAVYGGGIAAAMAALAIARAYGRVGVAVTWIDNGAGPAPHEALVAPPELAAFHRLLGIEDKALVRAAGGAINMGQQFAGWSGGEGAFLHAYGDVGASFASLPFIQHWTRARQAGLSVPLEDFCLAAAAAKQGRADEARKTGSGQTVKHGWHLDAGGYAGLLRAACQREGVVIVEGRCKAAEDDGGRVKAISLEGGQRLKADLFIDADGMLADAAVPIDPPPCDRLLRGSGPAFDPLPLYSRVTAHSAGWMTLIPLPDRTALEFAYASQLMSDEEARRAIAAMTGGRITAVDAPVPLALDGPARPWRGNVVAIGAAAGGVLPLDGADLLMLQLAVAQLVLLWPLDARAMPEAEIYNEEMAGIRARLGDFTAMHFRLAERRGESFWEAARARDISPELAAKIDLFAARGMFAHFSHEPHVVDSWALCLTGHGIVPRSFDPQAHGVDEQDLIAEFQRQLRAVAGDARAMPAHGERLREIAA